MSHYFLLLIKYSNNNQLLLIDRHDLYTHLQQPKTKSIQMLSVIGLYLTIIFLLLIRYSHKTPIVTDRLNGSIYSPTATKDPEYPTAVCYWSVPHYFLLLIKYSNKKPIFTDRPTRPIYSPTATKDQEYPTAVCYWSVSHHHFSPLDQIQP